MIGLYTLDREESSHVAKLFLIDVEAIAGPTVGIPDVGGDSGPD
jgi:hypothetical protein